MRQKVRDLLQQLLAGVREPDRRLQLAILGFPFLVLVPTVALTMANGFDGLYGQDAYAYYDYAIGPLREHLVARRGIPHFYWPPGYPLTVALTSLVLGPRPLAGQLVSLVAAASTPVWAALLAHELWTQDDDRRSWFVPLLAGLLVALTGQLWQSGIVLMADTAALAAATLGAWALARYRRRWQVGWLILAAGATAWAILTRWAYALVAFPVTLCAVVLLLRGCRRRALAHGSAGLLVAVLILCPVLPGAAEAVSVSAGDEARFAGNLQTAHWHLLNAFRRKTVSADGVLRHRLPSGLYYAITPGRSFYLTPLLVMLVVPGAWTVLRRRRAVPCLLLLGWPGVVYGFHAGHTHQNPRFALAYLPPLAILIALGAKTMARALGNRGRWILFGWVGAGIIWMTIGGTLLTQGFIDRIVGYRALVPWVELQVSPDAQLLTFGMTLTLEHESHLVVHELYFMETEDLTRLVNDEKAAYLLVDVANVETQWAGKPPAENFAWLRDGPGLTSLGSRKGFTLFRIDE